MHARSEAETERAALLPVAVLLGGRGTRLGDLARDTPKALVPVAGEPFLFHQLRLLASHGARRVVLCVGHLGEQIADAVSSGAQFGLDVEYAFDGPEPVGTAAALRQASGLLGERFLVTYGDAYLRADHGAVQDAFLRSGLPGLMTVIENDGRWVASNALFSDGVVTAYDKRTPPPEARWVDYGVLAFEERVFDEHDAADLSDLCRELAARGALGGFLVRERFYEIGTPEGLAEADAFLREQRERR
jgi:NDP-sugar pyrophosphorylase family protein